MPAITVKNIPDDLYHQIRKSATTHFRSINNEIIYRLQQSISPRKFDPEKFIAEIELIQNQINLPPLTDDFLKKAKEVGRP